MRRFVYLATLAATLFLFGTLVVSLACSGQFATATLVLLGGAFMFGVFDPS